MDFVTVKDGKIALSRTFERQEQAFEALLTEELKNITLGCQIIKNAENGLMTEFAVFDVLNVRDIGNPSIEPTNSSRCDMLILSDGFTECQAFEYNPWETRLSAGDRILILPPVSFKRKLLLLGPENILLLASSISKPNP
jgi:hypothetical protein